MRTSLIIILCALVVSTIPAWTQPVSSVGRGLLQRGIRGNISASAGIGQGVSSSIQKGVFAGLESTAMHPTIPPTISTENPILRSIFQARESPTETTNSFSGTVFQTERNGKKEIYLAVAAHALNGGYHVLHRNFIADIYRGAGKFVSVRAQIVQVSAPSMLDIALAKVLEGEEYLVPLTISRRAFGIGDTAISYGYAAQKLIVIPNRTFLSETPLCIRTTIPYPRSQRMGLCGSALLDEEGKLLGVHTGSSYPDADERGDIGHATNAALLETLVEASHHNGEGTFPLILGGKKILDMPVMGYISYIRLFDETGKQLWQREFESKFGYDQVNEAISIFSPRYIEITTRRAFWEEDYLLEVRASRDKSRRTYRYDFLEGKIIQESKPLK